MHQKKSVHQSSDLYPIQHLVWLSRYFFIYFYNKVFITISYKKIDMQSKHYNLWYILNRLIKSASITTLLTNLLLFSFAVILTFA